jgi:hypothetical protein
MVIERVQLYEVRSIALRCCVVGGMFQLSIRLSAGLCILPSLYLCVCPRTIAVPAWKIYAVRWS